jgi:2,3-bisphosphoglycerate-independent phosphoglycerate mutase
MSEPLKGNQKGVMLIADGMADRPVESLGGKTPLEAANTPHLDRLAAEGECGLMDPVAPGIRAGSDTSHLALLGYDPNTTYTGRGPFEAAGVGLEVKGGDICFRCNFATVDEKMIITDRRAGRIARGTSELAAQVDGLVIGEVKCFFKESVEHRGALVLRGPGLGHQVTDADPHAEGAKVALAEGGDEAGKKTAAVVNEFVARSYEALRKHPVNLQREKEGKPPANIILPRGAGVVPHLEPFEKRYRLRGAAVVETALIAGIARYLAMDVPAVPGATGGYDSDEIAIAQAVITALADRDFVICNFKAPDLAGHDGNAAKKVECIEKMDRLAGEIAKNLSSPTHIIVSADHSTPVTFKDHTGDTVPVLIWGPAVRPDGVKSFGERPCASGSLGRIRGQWLMPLLTNLMGTQEKFGA